MTDISDADFESLINKAMDELPPEYISNLDNVAITFADNPTDHQAEKIRLRGDQLLLGLYEGIPRIERGAGYNLVLPDRITLFKQPILRIAGVDAATLFDQIKRTLWHEIAHHYGLDHDRIHELEQKSV